MSGSHKTAAESHPHGTHKKAEEPKEPIHQNIDGSEDKRFLDNGRGKVHHPETDMRLAENRHNPEKVAERQKEMEEAAKA